MTSKNTNCNDRRAREEVLEAVLLGGTPSARAQSHLHECASCVAEWKQFEATVTLLDEWPEPEPSPYFNTRLQARLREETGKLVSVGDRVRAVGAYLIGLDFEEMHLWRTALAGALGLALVAGGVFIGTSTPSAKPKNAQSAVIDLQMLDRNADVLMEMNSIDDSGSLNP